jgi:N-acetylglucosamine-6-phosphate deacetylase
MSSVEIIARHYLTGEGSRLTWRDGVIASVVPAHASDTDPWLAPALFDVQVNGYGGVDFQQDNLSLEDLLRATRALRRDACAKYFFTLITAEWQTLMQRLRRAKELRDSSPELRDAIAGWHIEGPFLSEKPGFCGAHDPSVMIDPTAEHIRELRAIVGNDPLLLTIAPERNGAMEAIALARSLGITVSLGHTDASASTLVNAERAGATGFTHLANGCPRELDRHDNILWRVAETSGLTVSFIPDGIHVSPAPFRLLHRLIDGRRIYYTTDAMAAAGAGPGRFTIGKIEVEVGADQIVRQPGKTNFAGSALRPVDAPFRAATMLNAPWQECWQRMAEAPAKLVAVDNEIAVQRAATFCVISMHDGIPTVQTFVNGVKCS